MSNKRNRRRLGQRICAEVSRKPVTITKAQESFLSSLPAERKRKEFERYLTKPTKAERQAREKRIRRWRVLGKAQTKVRKPRTNYGNTYWRHSHDI